MRRATGDALRSRNMMVAHTVTFEPVSVDTIPANRENADILVNGKCGSSRGRIGAEVSGAIRLMRPLSRISERARPLDLRRFGHSRRFDVL